MSPDADTNIPRRFQSILPWALNNSASVEQEDFLDLLPPTLLGSDSDVEMSSLIADQLNYSPPCLDENDRATWKRLSFTMDDATVVAEALQPEDEDEDPYDWSEERAKAEILRSIRESRR
jgi:hypothetical protein